MKKTIFLIILVLMSTLALADIRLFNFAKDRYNLGDSLVVSFSTRTISDFNGLFKTSISCENYSTEYFITPLSMQANEQKSIEVFPLQLNDPIFVGTCYLKAELKPFGNQSGEEFQSQSITVTKEIPLTIDIKKENFMPGDALTIIGEAKTSHETFPKGTLQIALDDKTFDYPLDTRTFNQSYELGKNIKSGSHKISIIIDDTFGNHGTAEKDFSVMAVPTKLVNNLTKKDFMPEDEINLEVVLFDQAGDTMPAKSTTQILGPSKQILFSAEQDTQKPLSYKLEQTAVPGNYTLISTFSNLKAEDNINVLELSRVDVSFDNRYITFKNTGNVQYKKDFDIIIRNGKEYPVTVKLDLAPQAVFEVDMYKQVPKGIYTVVVPKDDNYLVYQNISLEDQRPLGKKTSMGMSAITGALFGSNDKTGKSSFPVLLIILLVVVIAGAGTGAYFYIKKRKTSKPKFGI